MDFSYGLAQKWLNITIKNMIVMEKWDSQLAKVKHYLHVPVDNYILDGARADFEDIVTSKKPWSKWNYEEYKIFQKALRKKLNVTPPIVWEFDVWVKMATREKVKQKPCK
jgi:hypothetical protein